ncbi:MAG: TonB family protein [Cyanobacteria bacterium]|nr:TonB family protein [Cyanobacteriota bacterium]
MESSSLSQSSIPSALQQREQERQRQIHSFKFTVPIALALHLSLGLGWASLIAKNMVDSPQEEVEIIVGDTPKENLLESGGNGGGSSAFSLFQGNGGAASGNVDGNNVATLGNPFSIPEPSPAVEPSPVENIAAPIEPDIKPIDPVTKASPEVPQEPKLEIKKKREEKVEEKSQDKSDPNSKTDLKTDKKTGVVPVKLGQFDGSASGKGGKGDRNTGKLNPNAANGWGQGAGVGSGSGAVGTGNGNGNRLGRSGLPNNSNQTKPNQMPLEASKPIVPVVMNPSAQSKPAAKKGPKCVENCGLSEYLGAEGTLRISQEISKDGTVIPKLLQSSGDPELDRKALEAISRRKYEASEDGDRTTIRVTSQQEGSDFQRQQESRRQQRQAEQDTIARERTSQEQEQQNRKPVVVPGSTAPESIAPESMAPSPEPIPTPVPSIISPPVLLPVMPEPAPTPESAPVAPVAPVSESVSVPAPLAPSPEPLAPPTP